jgi:hypothetical protein
MSVERKETVASRAGPLLFRQFNVCECVGTCALVRSLFSVNNQENEMKLTTIALAGALALSSTLAFAQMGGGNGEGATLPERSGAAVNAQGGVVEPGRYMEHRTTGMSRGTRMDSGNPNGDADGPTSLSGTGSSQFGGSVSGSTGKN